MKLLSLLFTLAMTATVAYAQEDYFLTYQNSTPDYLTYTNNTDRQSWGNLGTFIGNGGISSQNSQTFVASDTVDHFWDDDYLKGTVTIADNEAYTIEMDNPGDQDSFFIVSLNGGNSTALYNDLAIGNILTISFIGKGCIQALYNDQPLRGEPQLINLNNSDSGITCPTLSSTQSSFNQNAKSGVANHTVTAQALTSTIKKPPISQTGILPW